MGARKLKQPCRRGVPGRSVEVRPGPRRGGVVEPRAGRTPSEPLFVRAVDGHSDDEGWLLTVVDDTDRAPVTSTSSMHRRWVGGDPKPSSTCPCAYRYAATASGFRRSLSLSDREGSGRARRSTRTLPGPSDTEGRISTRQSGCPTNPWRAQERAAQSPSIEALDASLPAG